MKPSKNNPKQGGRSLVPAGRARPIRGVEKVHAYRVVRPCGHFVLLPIEVSRPILRNLAQNPCGNCATRNKPDEERPAGRNS